MSIAQTQLTYNDLLNTVKRLSIVELNKLVSQIIELQTTKMPTHDDEVIESAMNGTLDIFNVNKNNRLFELFPVIGTQKIICDFPSALLQKAITAIDHYVNVVGQYKYKSGHPYPYYVNVTEIEIYPDENELPSLFDLHGIAPNATKGLSSEDFVRGIRDEW
ncbi:hypothetical protein PN36_27270 [Candidatus Thiomargarita nelsonii]|uniref:Uncharacterized protein n=1 Tax=Candidatus Thiomargarita nelsonii TaxID=1003181 RepID=A0A4E0REN1_9GAMM|nr:hypothetical protein PN36_27250 [Candidatus Thiomargarita nelsonii]TGO02300.1 hypothetical protein PN36_27270 [Candidatus Thiomargarita nelsonii]